MCPASITHTVTLNYSRLHVAHDLMEGMVRCLGNYAPLLNSSVDELAGCLSDCQVGAASGRVYTAVRPVLNVELRECPRLNTKERISAFFFLACEINPAERKDGLKRKLGAVKRNLANKYDVYKSREAALFCFA